jgi:hypothetical protein
MAGSASVGPDIFVARKSFGGPETGIGEMVGCRELSKGRNREQSEQLKKAPGTEQSCDESSQSSQRSNPFWPGVGIVGKGFR